MYKGVREAYRGVQEVSGRHTYPGGVQEVSESGFSCSRKHENRCPNVGVSCSREQETWVSRRRVKAGFLGFSGSPETSFRKRSNTRKTLGKRPALGSDSSCAPGRARRYPATTADLPERGRFMSQVCPMCYSCRWTVVRLIGVILLWNSALPAIRREHLAFHKTCRIDALPDNLAAGTTAACSNDSPRCLEAAYPKLLEKPR